MARRRRRRHHLATIATVAGWTLASLTVGQAIRDHLAITLIVAVAGLAGAGAWGHRRHTRGRQIAAAERIVAVADTLSGPEFEHYVARLMRAGGCRRVRVCGSAGDMGADVTGNARTGAGSSCNASDTAAAWVALMCSTSPEPRATSTTPTWPCW